MTIPVIYQLEHRARKKLYDQGMTDQQIAEELDISPLTVKGWRNKNDLPCQNDPRRLPQDEEQRRQHLYDQGKTDREIADACGVSRRTITFWREVRDLPNNTS